MRRCETGRNIFSSTKAGTLPLKGTTTLLTNDEFTGFLKILGRRIRAIRKAKNLNMWHIIISTGYYDAQWRKHELGGTMNISTLMKIAPALDVPISELWESLANGL